MSNNPKKLPSSRYLNETRDILLSIVTNSKLTSSSKKYPIKEGLIFLTSVGVFEKLLGSYLFHPKLVRTDKDIHDAVKLWCTKRAKAIQIYGHIRDWDVCNVTNMKGLFKGQGSFNDDISKWNVSNVTNMKEMFSCTRKFNKNIGNWNVSNVTNMCSMFYNAYAFNHDIGGWNVSKVTNMKDIFYGNLAFNRNISNWNVSNGTNMKDMFLLVSNKRK
jgi:surface protein